MSRRIFLRSCLHTLCGRPTFLALFFIVTAVVILLIVTTGGGGNGGPNLTIALPPSIAVSDNGLDYPGDEIDVKVNSKSIDVQTYWPDEKEPIPESMEETPGGQTFPGQRSRFYFKKHTSNHDNQYLKISATEGGDKIKVYNSESGGDLLKLPIFVEMSTIGSSGYNVWVIATESGFSYQIRGEIVSSVETEVQEFENDSLFEKDKEGENGEEGNDVKNKDEAK